MDGQSSQGPSGPEAVEHAIQSRRSIRAFLPTPVEPGLVQRLLDVASRAPSGTNMQPWRVYVLTGAAKQLLSDAVLAAFDARASKQAQFTSEYDYYPAEFFEPYLGRRRKVGWDLYGLLGIAKGDTARMHAQHARNFRFFDAPVGLIFTIDRRLNIGSWLDYGMFLQNIMVAARAHGLDTCPQAAFAPFHAVIRETVPGLTDAEIVICGMALGYADPAAPENALVSDRVAAAEFTTFLT